MRLIDADAILARLEKKKASISNKRYTEGFNDALLRFRSMLSTEKTVDAVPVVHGRWEHDDWDLASCSVCGMIAVEDGTNYCPICGAKMDLEVDE